MLPAGSVGPAGAPFVGAVGITSRLESESVSSWGGSPPRLWSPSPLMTLCPSLSCRRSGACIAGGLGLRLCSVAVPESRYDVRMFDYLPVPVVVRVIARVVGVGGVGVRTSHRSRSVYSRGLALWAAGVARGRLRTPVGALCTCSGQAHPSLATCPEGERPGFAAHPWRARVRRCRDPSASTSRKF